MNQNIWGPHLWFSLHTISFVYPNNPTIEDKTNYKNFFTSLKNVIPCSICKKNYIRHLIEHPIDNFLDNRTRLVHWVIDIHNMVNGETGKKNLSYDVVLKKYSDAYNKIIKLDNDDSLCTKNPKECEEPVSKNKKNIFILLIRYLLFFFIFLLIINLVFMISYKKY
jgi:hypothetical protein